MGAAGRSGGSAGEGEVEVLVDGFEERGRHALFELVRRCVHGQHLLNLNTVCHKPLSMTSLKGLPNFL